MSDLGELERRWRQSRDEADRHRWLCEKLRLGWGEELAGDIEALKEAVDRCYDDPDVHAVCAVAFETDEPTPESRLARLTRRQGGSPSWWPVARGEAATYLETALDVQGFIGLYPFDAFDSSEVAGCFAELFEGARFFANFKLHKGGRSSSPVYRCPAGWEWHVNMAIGAALGPLVGFISLNARESL